MPFSVPQFSSRNSEDSHSWRRRVLENVRVAFSIPHSSMQAVSRALAAFSSVEASARYGSAQTISAITHVAILAGLFLVLASTGPKVADLPPILIGGPNQPFRFFPPPELKTGVPSLGPAGHGSNTESEPARTGNLAPVSSLPLAPPRLTHSEQIDLPVPPAVFDPNAPSAFQVVTGLGLPWAKKDTNSAGADGGHGIGDLQGDNMGDDDGDKAGAGGPGGNYANVVSQAACLYCPEPPYTDEARKAKLQGNVTLRVLIGADGRAAGIQLVKGLGLGLDEQALQAVRSWRFVPARDARRQPIPTWVTIETRFQLF
jgi:protein TonB